jgi:hypothetical protein
MQTAMTDSTALNHFCIQLNEFCLIFQEQILLLKTAPGKSPSIALALAFSESLILCPTLEAVRLCIRRDLPGARSFLMASDAALRRIRSGRFQLDVNNPQFQTKFYLLGCGINDFLRTRRQQVLAHLEPSSRTA